MPWVRQVQYWVPIADREDIAEMISRIAPEHCLALLDDRNLYREVCAEAAVQFKDRLEALRGLSRDEREYTSLLAAIEYRDGRFREKMKAAA